MATPHVRTPYAPRRAPIADIVVTVLLGGVGVTGGIFLGFLYVIFAPLAPSPILWMLGCLTLMVVPVVTAVLGIVQLVRRRRGFWWPLIGIVVGAIVFALIVVVGGTGGEVIPADFG